MKKIILTFYFLLFTSAFILNPAYAGSSRVNQWIKAMKNNGEGLNAIITHDFEYRQLGFDFGKRLTKSSRGNIPFFAKDSTPSTIEVEETKGSSGGQVVILNTISEDGFYREWKTILLIRPDGIARISEIAKEGLIKGYPQGCPETIYKRDFIMTLRGNPDGFAGPKTIKLETYRRSTDPIEYAHPSLDDKDKKKCKPKPNRSTIFSEIIVFDLNNQLEQVNTVAIRNKNAGGIFFKENGTNFPGRLFNIGGGKEALFLTFEVEKSSGKSDIAKLYVWRGNSWKSVWGFDVGHCSKGGFAGGYLDKIEWMLKSRVGTAGTPEIIAKLMTNDDSNYRCPVGTTIIYQKSGSGFRPVKSGQAGACFKRNLSGGIMASAGNDERPKKILSEEEIDWRFE